MLLAFKLLTSTAVTGPGRSELPPSAAQVELAKTNSTTLFGLFPDKEIEPAATRTS